MKKVFWHALSVALTVGALAVLTVGNAFAGSWD
jgi:hypothetical protein